MYEIIFYEDKNGNSEVINYINKLKEERNSNKNSRINLNKIVAYFKENRFVILHHFVKKTKKTPKKEIERAKKNLCDFLEREGRDGN